MAEEFQPIMTEDGLNAIIKDRVKQAEAGIKSKYADYDTIKNSLSVLQTEKATLEGTANTYKTQLEDAQGKLKVLELESLKTKVSIEAGLPMNLRDRLHGETEEELKNDAESLVKLIGKPATPPPLRINEPETAGDEKTQALKNIVKNLRAKEN